MAQTLYQQGTRRIEIIVRKESGAAEVGTKEKETEQVSSEQSSETQSNQVRGMAAFNRNFSQRLIIMHGLRTMNHALKTSINYVASGIGQRNGDQALQEQVERNVEIMSDIGSIATSTLSGVFMGAKVGGGVPGAIAGGVIGLASSSFNTATKYMDRERDFNYKVFKENNSIEYNRARASISLTTGRLR